MAVKSRTNWTRPVLRLIGFASDTHFESTICYFLMQVARPSLLLLQYLACRTSSQSAVYFEHAHNRIPKVEQQALVTGVFWCSNNIHQDGTPRAYVYWFWETVQDFKLALGSKTSLFLKGSLRNAAKSIFSFYYFSRGSLERHLETTDDYSLDLQLYIDQWTPRHRQPA